SVRGAHRAVRRNALRRRAVRARSDDDEAFRRSALLFARARRAGRGSRSASGERVRARRAAEAADGIRGGSAETFGSQPRGERGMRFLIIAGWFAALAACGQPQEKGGDTISDAAPPVEEATGPQHDFSDLEPVNAALLAAPTSTFAAIEP